MCQLNLACRRTSCGRPPIYRGDITFRIPASPALLLTNFVGSESIFIEILSLLIKISSCRKKITDKCFLIDSSAYCVEVIIVYELVAVQRGSRKTSSVVADADATGEQINSQMLLLCSDNITVVQQYSIFL